MKLVVLVAVLLALFVPGRVAIAQEAPIGNPIVPSPAEIHVTNTTVVNVPPMDPQAVSDATAIANQSFVVNTVQPIPVSWTNAMCSLPNIWTTTPASVTWQDQELRSFAGTMGQVGMALAGLAIAACGLSAMFGADVQERLGRVALALVVSAANLLLWEWGIGLNDAITAVISPPDVCGALIKPNIVIQTPDVGSSVAAPALVIVYAAVSLLLLISLAFRLGLIRILIAVGGLAAMCWADERTEWIARWYQRISIGTLYGQVLLAVGLRAAKVGAFGTSGLAATLLSIVILLICRKLLDSLSSSPAAHGGASTGMTLALMARRLILKAF